MLLISRTCELDITVVCFGIVPDYAAQTVRVQLVFELPECVPAEVTACDSLTSHRKRYMQVRF